MATSLERFISADCRCADLAGETDPREKCVACLGPDHATDGLQDPPECPSCALLTIARRRERRAFFDEVIPLEGALSSDSDEPEEESSSEEEREVRKARSPAPLQTPAIFSRVPRDQRSRGEEDMNSVSMDSSTVPTPRPSLRATLSV
ncbi:hypothetical protein DPEC_G00146990 [Dallia pectoralis]|uniref:Uncharacterized protein n=1 Tax=Dallia pectoralis TaxID=75939 RepID=A0ACC2GPI4_DALPE|nr:hypothetical protein DPEC_G00146990 [Dallia pectoralis]